MEAIPEWMPIALQDGWLYGPVDSRRYGRSLGVNPLPVDQKVCSLDCLYCQYGFTRAQQSAGKGEVPTVHDLRRAFDEEFARLARDKDVPDQITVAGNGEPTLHPEFLHLSRHLAMARDEHFGPGTKIGLLTNGMHLLSGDVLEAIQTYYDEAAIKLETGTPDGFAALYRVSRGGLERTLEGLSHLDSFVIQSLFVRTPTAHNASEVEVEAWLRHLERFQDQIRQVEIYTLDRPPSHEAEAEAVPLERLEQIAERVRALSLTALVFHR